MVKASRTITRKNLKQAQTKMNWGRVEELLAEKLADRVKIKLKIRDAEETDIEDAGDDMEFSMEELEQELGTRELLYFFINRHFNKINKVG